MAPSWSLLLAKSKFSIGKYYLAQIHVLESMISLIPHQAKSGGFCTSQNLKVIFFFEQWIGGYVSGSKGPIFLQVIFEKSTCSIQR